MSSFRLSTPSPKSASPRPITTPSTRVSPTLPPLRAPAPTATTAASLRTTSTPRSTPATPFTGSKPKTIMNDFGGFIGGPVSIPHLYNGHDKTFALSQLRSPSLAARGATRHQRARRSPWARGQSYELFRATGNRRHQQPRWNANHWHSSRACLARRREHHGEPISRAQPPRSG